MTGNKKKLVPIALMSIAAFAVVQAGVAAPLISSAGNNPVSNPIASSGESSPLKSLIVTPTDRISGCNIGLKYAAISKKYWCGDYAVDPDIAIINASAPVTQILACASYVNQYGIPGNYTLGNFTRVVETNVYNPAYNTVISVNISGCSAQPPVIYRAGLYDVLVSNKTSTSVDVQIAITNSAPLNAGLCNSSRYWSPVVTLYKGVPTTYTTGSLATNYSGYAWGYSGVRFDGSSVYIYDTHRMGVKYGVGVVSPGSSYPYTYLDVCTLTSSSEWSNTGYYDFVYSGGTGSGGGCPQSSYTFIQTNNRPDQILNLY